MNLLSSSSNIAPTKDILISDSFEKSSNPKPDQTKFLGKKVEEVTVKPKTKRRKMTPEIRAKYKADLKIKNRISAQLSRDNTKIKLSHLENKVQELSTLLEEKKKENCQLKE